MQVLKFEFSEVQDFGNFELAPMELVLWITPNHGLFPHFIFRIGNESVPKETEADHPACITTSLAPPGSHQQ